MRYSIGVEYALHTMVYMVSEKENEAFSIKELAKFQGISESYLSKIYTRLTKAGLVKSVPGIKGGYALNKEACDISFWDVIEAVEGSKPLFVCDEIRKRNVLVNEEEALTYTCDNPCFIKTVMSEAEEQMQNYLKSKSLLFLHEEVYTNIMDEKRRIDTKDWFNEN